MLSGEGKSGHEDDDDGMPEVDRVGESGNGMKHVIIEPFSYVFCPRRKEYKKCDKDGREGESVRSLEPRVFEVPGFSDKPEEGEESEEGKDKKHVFPERLGALFLFSPDENPPDDGSQEEVESEYEGVIRREPYGHDTIELREREAHKSEMESDEDSRCCKYDDGDKYFAYFEEYAHHPHDEECSHHIVGDVPERTIDINWKESKRMDPGEKSNTGKISEDGTILVPIEKDGEKESKCERDIVCWGDSKKSAHKELASLRYCHISDDGSPKWERVCDGREHEKEAHIYGPGFDKLIKIPVPEREIGDGAMLIEMVEYDTQARKCPESIETQKWASLGHRY